MIKNPTWSPEVFNEIVRRMRANPHMYSPQVIRDSRLEGPARAAGLMPATATKPTPTKASAKPAERAQVRQEQPAMKPTKKPESTNLAAQVAKLKAVGEIDRRVTAPMVRGLETSGQAVPDSLRGTRRTPSIAGGFTADCSREEAERILAKRSR